MGPARRVLRPEWPEPVGLTDWNLGVIAQLLLQQENKPPFTFQVNHDERRARLLELQKEMENKADFRFPAWPRG
jgi:hypothetical protein